jgi:hypothetical protein
MLISSQIISRLVCLLFFVLNSVQIIADLQELSGYFVARTMAIKAIIVSNDQSQYQ